MLLNRRKLITTGMKGLAAIAAGRYLTLSDALLPQALAHGPQSFTIRPREVLLEMVDLTRVYHWAWDFAVPPPPLPAPGAGNHAGHAHTTSMAGPRIPGPVIVCHEGDSLTFTLENPLDEPHAFAVDGVPGSETGPVAPGASRTVSFSAPAAGTYMYLDPLNLPIHRVMGLHGMLIVLPMASNTPYGAPTPAVQKLFNDFGTSPQFPGDPWDPVRTHIWIFGSIDPAMNARIQRNEAITPEQFRQQYVARYYSLSGRQGYFCAHDPAISLIGIAGQPRLIRNMNVGMCVHSPHVHANHAYFLCSNHQIQQSVRWIDTWTCLPGGCYDVLYPMIKPPDIPADTWQRLKNGTSQETFLNNPMLPRQGGFPMFYPMHCHLEMSQTSGGGNYPQGLVTHIEFTGAHPNA